MSSYRGRSKGSYGNRPRRSIGSGWHRGFSKKETQQAQNSFENRSKASQIQDRVRLADIAPNIQVYLAHPNRFDFPGIDTPSNLASLTNEKTRATSLAVLSAKTPVELEVQEKYPEGKSKVHRFKVLRKKEADKLKKEQDQKAKELKQKEEEGPIKDSRMPSHKEIVEKAQQLYMADNGRFQDLLGTNLPEESELKQEGYLKRAQIALLETEDSAANKQVTAYVENIRNELQRIGFDVVPIAGFSL